METFGAVKPLRDPLEYLKATYLSMCEPNDDSDLSAYTIERIMKDLYGLQARHVPASVEFIPT